MIARKRIALIGLAAAGTLGTVAASAATLGGITSASLGASESAITSCDSDGVAVAFAPAFSNVAPANGVYTHGNVTISGIAPACNGKTLKVRLRNVTTGIDTVMANGSAVIAGTSVTVTTFTTDAAVATVMAASAVSGIAITVHD